MTETPVAADGVSCRAGSIYGRCRRRVALGVLARGSAAGGCVCPGMSRRSIWTIWTICPSAVAAACSGSCPTASASRPPTSAPPSWRRRPGSPRCSWSGAPAAGSCTWAACRPATSCTPRRRPCPRAAEMPTGPVSADAVLLTTMQVMPEFSGEGLGRMLAQAVAKDLTRRGVKAIEVFGDQRPGTEPGCVVPADFLRAVGFKTIRPHPRWPRLRMELRSRDDLEGRRRGRPGAAARHDHHPDAGGRTRWPGTQPSRSARHRPAQRPLRRAAAARPRAPPHQMACAPPRSSSWASTSENVNVPVGWSS